MDARVTRLEALAEETTKRFDRIDARFDRLEERMDNFATKAQAQEIRADIHKAITENHRWTHNALIGIAGITLIGIVGLLMTIWNASKPGAQPAVTPAAQQQPIIINIPSPATPPAAPASR